MELSQEDWEELWPDLRVILDGVEEAPLRNAVAKIYATQVDSPQARENFWRVLDNPLATASTNGLKQFVKRTERVAFERAINRGLGLLRGGLAEWERLAEEGNVSSRPQGLDQLSTNILIDVYSSGPGVTRAAIAFKKRRSQKPWGEIYIFPMGQHGKLYTSKGM